MFPLCLKEGDFPAPQEKGSTASCFMTVRGGLPGLQGEGPSFLLFYA